MLINPDDCVCHCGGTLEIVDANPDSKEFDVECRDCFHTAKLNPDSYANAESDAEEFYMDSILQIIEG